MKVTKIEIKDFHQFMGFSIDLTYPKGHKKEGKPLDKVCFIGQSGTGKTTLLELLPKFLFDYDTNLISKTDIAELNKVKIYFNYGEHEQHMLRARYESGSWQWDNTINRDDFQWTKYYEKEKELRNSKLVYFPSNLNYDLSIDEDNIQKSIRSIVDFSKDNVAIVWNLILDEIQNYQEEELKLRQDISKAAEQSLDNIESIRKAVLKLENWKKTEYNPAVDVANNCLDELLNHFNLKVKTELDIKKKEDIGFIKIQDFNNNEIPNGLWSTGTKQVILSAMPPYLLKPKKNIILFDEPERSLFPDLQRLIVNYYLGLADDCQFFYATHSPIIASNFEPWEIVELKFNEEGKIYRELYYEGENHINNYKFNPKLMRWDDILQRIFDMENDGSEERQLKLNELATLNVKFKKLQKEGKENSAGAKKIIKEIEVLSKELSKW